MRLSEYSAEDQQAMMPYSEEELALVAIARRREAEKELADRAFRAGLNSAARWFAAKQGSPIPRAYVVNTLEAMSRVPDEYFYEEDDNATDPDSPA